MPASRAATVSASAIARLRLLGVMRLGVVLVARTLRRHEAVRGLLRRPLRTLLDLGRLLRRGVRGLRLQLAGHLGLVDPQRAELALHEVGEPGAVLPVELLQRLDLLLQA